MIHSNIPTAHVKFFLKMEWTIEASSVEWHFTELKWHYFEIKWHFTVVKCHSSLGMFHTPLLCKLFYVSEVSIEKVC